jgi:tetratricopeptide (TPR) repeat protein
MPRCNYWRPLRSILSPVCGLLTSIGRLAGFLNDGTVSAEGAKQFLADARETLDDMANTEGHSPDISQVEMSLLLTVSDVNAAVGLYDDALALARRVENISQQLVRKYPDNPDIQHLVFAAKFRIGDELARRLQNRAAEKAYREAFATMSQLASSDPADIDHQRDVAFIRNKIGDLLMSRRDWQAAMDEFNAGLQIAEAVAEKYPGDIATQKSRIAQLLSERGEPGDDLAALAQYQEALAIQTQLLTRTPGDATLLSNIAMTHRRIGGMLKAKPDEARLEYEAAVANRKKLYEGDPGNVIWRHDLAVDYTLLGDVLMQEEQWSEASQDYDLAAQTGEGLVLKDPSNVGWQQSFAVANMKRGDTLIRLGNDAIVRPEPVLDASSRLIEDALGRYRVAAEDFAKLANNPKGGPARYLNLFDVRIRIGDVLVRQNKYKAALEAYQSASAAAEQAEPGKPIADWQTRLSASLEQVGDFLTRPSSPCCQPASREDTLAFYQKALELIQAAANKQPDDQNLQAKKSAIAAKIEGFVGSPRSRVQ